jgi:predicted nucleic acid-binding protein
VADAKRGTLVDSNVLLDVLTQDPEWLEWSAARLVEAVDEGPVVINQVVYGEVAHRFTSVEAMDAALSPQRFVRGNLPWPAAFLAATSYRLRLLTRDASRYRTYYPTVELVAPV